MKKDFVDQLSVILAKKKLISIDDLVSLHKEFYDKSNISFEDFLIEEDIIQKEDLLAALSEYYQVPAIDVTGEFFEHNNLRLVPKGVMLRHLFIPISVNNDTLTVVAANPNDPSLEPVIAQYFNHNFEIMVGLPKDIQMAIAEFYDKSIEYQPNDIENRQMERSQMEVHPMGQEIKQEDIENREVPLNWQNSDDDYEKE